MSLDPNSFSFPIFPQKKLKWLVIQEEHVSKEVIHKKFKTLRDQITSFKRGLGFIPLNDFFSGSEPHHLQIEGSKAFVIYIPHFLHRLQYHNPKTGCGMDTVNALAFDYWINENIYSELFLDT